MLDPVSNVGLKMIRKFLWALLVFAFNVSLAAPRDDERKSVEVVSAEFGVFYANNSREMVFEPTWHVPHRQG